MHKLLSLCAAATLVFTMGVGHAADSDAKTKQQTKMGTCSADFKATGKDGKERQAFMKECLSNKEAPAAKPAAAAAPASTTAPAAPAAPAAAAPAAPAAPATKK